MAYEYGIATFDRGLEKVGERSSPRAPLKLSRNEELVFRELSLKDTPVKAYQLLDSLMAHGLRSPMTIYRALDSLIKKGFAKKVISQNAFIALKSDDVAKVSAFMTCSTCKQTRKIEISKSLVEGMFGTESIALQEVFIEANGKCLGDDCSAQGIGMEPN
ncbi:MAG: hypothetical protein MRY59_08290 [Aquisalinus sp.]|nr:hypothetical protein [Aquisalinus sp.]